VSRLKRRELPRGVLPTTITTIGAAFLLICHSRWGVLIEWDRLHARNDSVRAT
jgi:hypothetical protein